MKNLEESIVTTKSGLELKIVTRINLNFGNKKWCYHDIKAFINDGIEDKEVGLLRIAYVNEEKKKEYFNNIIYFNYNYKSNRPVRSGIEKYSDLTIQDIDRLVSVSGNYQEKLEYLKIRLKLDGKKEYEKFMKYHYNKPEADMIKVDEEYRRKGIGLELYKKAVELCDLNGLNFYQSTNQTDDAIAIWNFIKKDISNVNSYSYVSYKDKTLDRYYIGNHKPELVFNDGMKRDVKKKIKNTI